MHKIALCIPIKVEALGKIIHSLFIPTFARRDVVFILQSLKKYIRMAGRRKLRPYQKDNEKQNLEINITILVGCDIDGEKLIRDFEKLGLVRYG